MDPGVVGRGRLVSGQWKADEAVCVCVRLPKRDLTSWEEKWNERDEGVQSRQSCPR